MSFPRPSPTRIELCRLCTYAGRQTDMVSVAAATGDETRGRSGWLCVSHAEQVRRTGVMPKGHRR